MHLQQEGTRKLPDFETQGMKTFDKIISLEEDREEKVRLQLAQEAEEDRQLEADCEMQKESDWQKNKRRQITFYILPPERRWILPRWDPQYYHQAYTT